MHLNATGAEVRDLYSRAALFWHATGLGEDEETHPERLEHFGISTVEAMSAGAVPVVIGRAGQLELFEDGIAGYHWQTLDELVARTGQLMADPVGRAPTWPTGRSRRRPASAPSRSPPGSRSWWPSL